MSAICCRLKVTLPSATQRHRMLLRLLRQFGVEEERCWFDYVSAGEGDKFVQVVTDFEAKLKSLAPLRGSSVTPAARHPQA